MTDPSAAAPTRTGLLKERLKDHIAEYGTIALVIFISIAILTLVGMFIAIKSGADVGDSAADNAGTFVAAWVAYKLAMPFRIGATIALTPIAAAVMHRIKGARSSHNKAPEATDQPVDGSDYQPRLLESDPVV